MEKSWMAGFCCMGLLASQTVLADTYLCVAEGAAGVRHTADGDISASVYDHKSLQFIQSNLSGEWVVKVPGDDSAIFDSCVSEFLCESSRGAAGSFFRTTEGLFSATIILGDGTAWDTVVAKGYCTKLD
ncbi:hypothetical protein MSNKSG1_00743 [Marinobacter santoriniensis NKSG1]|uniref:Uncharacterized protein n=1 Tax=Marinobacter santoriniensis NKSG1 TaxID=1288826 RepID=M7CXX9_9GAMM|nr:hypothetical protein MSNKSG1_00743 [Marinobacter santoriniensis NKSG1]